jgi:steroid delta-isomerase-like uncharacterized protein
MMTQVEAAAGLTLPYFGDAEQFSRAIAEIPDRWVAHAEEMLGWLDRWLSAWNEHDLDALTPLVAEDLLWADPIMIGRYVRGRDEFRNYVQTFWTGFPDIVFEPIAEPFIGVAGMRMMVQWRMTGTLTGPLAWWGTRQGEEPPTWAPTGRSADITGCDIYEFRDGQLAKYTILADFLSLSQQLGLMPPTESPITRVMLRVQNLVAPIARRRYERRAGRSR